MKVIYLYGPPAVGKLTTAKELSKVTGFKIFHNHLSFDFVNSVIPIKNNEKVFFNMIKEINLFFFSKIPDNIAKGIIITNCYEEKKDKEYVRNIQSIFNKNGNETFFIRLEADKDLLLNRVENEDRKKTTKIQDREVLKKILKEDDYTTNIIENKRNLVINNSNINVTEVVEEICNFIK